MEMLLRIGEDLKQVCDKISAILGRTEYFF